MIPECKQQLKGQPKAQMVSVMLLLACSHLFHTGVELFPPVGFPAPHILHPDFVSLLHRWDLSGSIIQSQSRGRRKT